MRLLDLDYPTSLWFANSLDLICSANTVHCQTKWNIFSFHRMSVTQSVKGHMRWNGYSLYVVGEVQILTLI